LIFGQIENFIPASGQKRCKILGHFAHFTPRIHGNALLEGAKFQERQPRLGSLT
jgi:hypothetical protein